MIHSYFKPAVLCITLLVCCMLIALLKRNEHAYNYIKENMDTLSSQMNGFLPNNLKQHCLVYDVHKPLQEFQKQFTCVDTTTDPSVKICVYTKNEFRHTASAEIIRLGAWEKNINNQIIKFLKQDPESGFIDIGTSIGAHTLPAAKLGHKVISVEPSEMNIERLHASIKLNHLEDNIVVVQNALSNTRGIVDVYRSENARNKALQSIIKSGNEVIVDQYHSIYMDDLLEVIPFKSAVIKIDIEGAEPLAFSNSAKLFETLNIKAVFLENRGRGDKTNMINMFYKYGYKPMTVDLLTELKSSKDWPIDYVWVKK